MNNKSNNKAIYSICVIGAGCLWGTMGYFRRTLGSYGLSSFNIVFLRCIVSAGLFGILMLLKDRSLFKIKLKDLWCFIGSGVVSLLFFSACYFQAMTYMSLSAAAILLYTAPCFVMLISAALFGERITKRKIAAMLLAFAGCCLTSGITSGNINISLVGILYGIGSGIGYALYSIFGKLAFERGYGSLTVNFWSCLFAGLGAGIIWGVGEPAGIMFSSAGKCGFIILAAVITTFLPYLLYTFGLEGTEAGKASVMASVEPVVATIVGLIAFGEAITVPAGAGIALVILAIILLG